MSGDPEVFGSVGGPIEKAKKKQKTTIPFIL